MIEAMKHALEAFNCIYSPLHMREIEKIGSAMSSIRTAIAEAEKHEPVKWLMPDGKVVDEWGLKFYNGVDPKDITPLYTTPPASQKPLTDEQTMALAYKAGFDIHEDYDNDDDPETLHWWTADGEVCDESLFKLRDLIEAAHNIKE